MGLKVARCEWEADEEALAYYTKAIPAAFGSHSNQR
jgi:hypothetical protein